MFMLLLVKDLLAKFLVTYTLKNKLTTWLCLVEGNLASLHDLVSFKTEHSKGSRVRHVTEENTIDKPSLELTQLPTFLQDKAFASKLMKVTHLGGSTMHQLVESFLLTDPKVDPIGHISHGIDRLNQNLFGVLCSPSISHRFLYFLSTTPF
jgi:hypothetical protein